MADKNSGAKPADDTDAKLEVKPAAKGPQFRVISQYIKDLSFENPNAPLSLVQPAEKPGVKVDVGVGVKKIAANTFETALSFEAHATQGSSVLYNLELDFAGLFHIENMPVESLEPVLMVNCPALLFPFIRRIVADLTRDGGFAPLWLDPIDFAALYVQNKKAQAATAEQKPTLVS